MAGIIKGEPKLLQEVNIWEFEKLKVEGSSSSGWKKIARMPPYLYQDISRGTFDFLGPFGCTVVGDCVCFSFFRVAQEL